MPNKTITQVPVAAKHVKRIVLEPSTIVGDVVTWKIAYDYDPVNDLGSSIRGVVKTKSDLSLTAGQQTTLQTFVSGPIVTDANMIEGT